MRGTLSFHGIRLFGYHGIHREEIRTGGTFVLDVTARTRFDFSAKRPELSDTLNYEDLLPLIREVFAKREDLIEQVAVNLMQALQQKFPHIAGWRVRITKENPLGNGLLHPVFTLDTD